MAYNEELANRLREQLQDEPGLTERAMFGGLGFMITGNMAVAAASRGALMVRIDPADGPGLTTATGVELMVMRGRAMPGWLLVDAGVVETDEALATYVASGVAYARTLPAK